MWYIGLQVARMIWFNHTRTFDWTFNTSHFRIFLYLLSFSGTYTVHTSTNLHFWPLAVVAIRVEIKDEKGGLKKNKSHTNNFIKPRVRRQNTGHIILREWSGKEVAISIHDKWNQCSSDLWPLLLITGAAYATVVRCATVLSVIHVDSTESCKSDLLLNPYSKHALHLLSINCRSPLTLQTLYNRRITRSSSGLHSVHRITWSAVIHVH